MPLPIRERFEITLEQIEQLLGIWIPKEKPKVTIQPYYAIVEMTILPELSHPNEIILKGENNGSAPFLPITEAN